MRKVGIMGGTFNPIHNGHLRLAEQAYKQFSLDEVLFMPCGRPYMKADQDVESGRIRAGMAEAAIMDNPHFKLSTMEIEQSGNTYTYRTMERLKKDNPDTDYYYIVGADSLFYMSEWKCPERIFSNCCVLAAIRDDKTPEDMEEQIRLLKQTYGANIYLLTTERMDISSSEIRRKVRAGKSIENDVPAAVKTYIEERELYK